MCGKLAKRETSCRHRFEARNAFPDLVQHQQAVQVECRLATGGAGELLERPLEHDLAEVESERLVGPLEQFPRPGIVLDEVLPHAH